MLLKYMFSGERRTSKCRESYLLNLSADTLLQNDGGGEFHWKSIKTVPLNEHMNSSKTTFVNREPELLSLTLMIGEPLVWSS